MEEAKQIIDPWVHRSEGMRCKTCIWFVPKQAEAKIGYDLGRCRRHAPTMGGYPVVYQTDWCGDHRIDENKI
jgi:Pyruvate/2-oxoacid:ferredoxin oxidoreductase delta subunit